MFKEELEEFIEKNYKSTILNHYRVGKTELKINFYLPEKKLALIFNKSYDPETSNTGGLKMLWKKDCKNVELCRKKGIKLVVIWKNDYILNPTKVKNMILQLIN